MAMGARYYDPLAGRFLSPDPLGHAASMDLYSYANGDPINFVDPTGRAAGQQANDGVIGTAFGNNSASGAGWPISWKEVDDTRKAYEEAKQEARNRNALAAQQQRVNAFWNTRDMGGYGDLTIGGTALQRQAPNSVETLEGTMLLSEYYAAKHAEWFMDGTRIAGYVPFGNLLVGATTYFSPYYSGYSSTFFAMGAMDASIDVASTFTFGLGSFGFKTVARRGFSEAMSRTLNSGGDVMRSVLGPARLSHAAEFELTLNRIAAAGHEVIVSGRSANFFSPGLRPGQAGQLNINFDISISGLRHEARHVWDYDALGRPGFRMTPAQYWQSEFDAYMIEINMAREMGRYDLGLELLNYAREQKANLGL